METLHHTVIPRILTPLACLARPTALATLVLAVTTLAAGIGPARAQDPASTPSTPDPHAAHGAHGAAATPAAASAPLPAAGDFIQLDPATPRTVLLTLVSAYNAANYGMNFNGFAKGGAQLVVPTGWTVTVNFRNQSPVPHSAIVVDRPQVKKLQMGKPVFQGASTPDPVRGTTGPAITFSFVASEPGDYAIACGFPAHAANGHWIAFEVSDTATAPSLQFGKAEPYTPR